jgi:hypothetical protein
MRSLKSQDESSGRPEKLLLNDRRLIGRLGEIPANAGGSTEVLNMLTKMFTNRQ